MATIRKRQLKNGGNAYTVQVKFKDKGSGKTILETTTWRPDGKMTAKQEERAVQTFAEEFERQIKATVNGATSTTDTPNITFREFAAQWLAKVERDCSKTYYVKARDSISLANEYIGGYKLRELTPAIIQNFYDKLDAMKKKTSKVFPKPDFRAVLEKHSLNYMKLRYEVNIQSCTLANAFAGKAVSKNWSSDFAERTGIPFHELFDEKITEEPYAYETIHKFKRIIRAVLSLAKKNRLITDNYASADYINFPKRPPHKIECMSDEDAKRFYKFILDYPDIRYKSAMLLFLLAGFRRGEVAGLEWKDIDFDKGEITVSRSVTTVTGFGIIEKEPKTEMSKRTLAIPEVLLETLKEYKEWQTKRRAELGDYMEENDYLFTQENGKRLYPSTFTGWLNKMLREANIDHYSLHSLRHTNITLQIAAGVPIVTVAARAGHARASTTSDIYAYALRSTDKMAADKLGSIFSAQEKPAETLKSSDQETVSDTDENDAVAEFRHIKAEMQRLGFETLEEYEEYLDFLEVKRAKKRDFEM